MSMLALRDRVLMIPVFEQKLNRLQNNILKSNDDVSRLLQQYEKESRDMERIQNNSLSSFMLKLIGKYDDKLEKEQREEIDAKLAYDRAVTYLESLEQEKNELITSILALQIDKESYQAELTNRRNELAFRQDDLAGVQYANLENERNTIVSQITEIKQALNAAAKVELTAQEALKALESASSWATYDAFMRGGIISHMVKYSRIDNAEQNFHKLSSQLRCLKSELSDVDGLIMPELKEISSGQRVVDFWFDNIFTDLSVRRKVNDNAEQISNLLRSIKAIESALKSKLKQSETELDNNRSREEDLLISMR